MAATTSTPRPSDAVAFPEDNAEPTRILSLPKGLARSPAEGRYRCHSRQRRAAVDGRRRGSLRGTRANKPDFPVGHQCWNAGSSLTLGLESSGFSMGTFWVPSLGIFFGFPGFLPVFDFKWIQSVNRLNINNISKLLKLTAELSFCAAWLTRVTRDCTAGSSHEPA